MLNISRSHRRFITLPTASAPTPEWWSLYSPDYTTDGKPRQSSVDFKGMKDYGAEVGVPDLMHLYGNVWIRLTEKLQRWYFDVLCLSGYGKLPKDMTRAERTTAEFQWLQLMKHGVAFNNHSGVDTKADYIRGVNLEKEDPYFEPLIAGGNLVDVVGGDEYFGYDYLRLGWKRYRHLPIRAVNTNDIEAGKLLPQDFLKDRAVCHTATTMRPDGTAGIFWQFNERTVYPIWVKGAERVYVWDRLIGSR